MKKEAEEELAKFNLMHQAQKAGALTRDFYLTLAGATAETVTLRAAIDDWLESANIADGTLPKYRSAVNAFADYLNATDKGPLLEEIDTKTVRAYLRHRQRETSTANANSVRKTLSAFFGWHFKNEAIAENPLARVDALKADAAERQRSGRRAFTLEEVKTAYKVAPDDFWRFMILAGFFTGLRLGDLASLKWESIDFADGMIRVKTAKVGKTVRIPLRATLRAMLERLAAKQGDDTPRGFIWPERARQYAEKQTSGILSHEFRRVILEPAGLVMVRKDKSSVTPNSESPKRDTEAALSFHCLRHTFVSLLKLTGGNQAIAKELAGHSSDLVSDLYTHVPADALKGAIAALPEVGQ